MNGHAAGSHYVATINSESFRNKADQHFKM